MSSTGRQSGSKGVRSAGAKLGHRRGDPHRRQDRISAAPSLFSRLQGCSFPGAAVTSRHTRDSKQQKCVVSQPGGCEPQIQGLAGPPSLLRPQGRVLPSCLSQLLGAPAVHPLAWGCSPPLFTYVLPVSLDQVLPLCMSELCVQISPSYKDTSHAELGPTLRTSSQLDYIFKDFISK